MKISNLFTKIAKNKTVQKFYKKICDPSKQAEYTRHLLTADTVASTVTYMVSTNNQKNIDKDSRDAMQIQHVTSCFLSIGVCTPINKKIGNIVESVASKLNSKIIDVHKCKAGLTMLAPLIVVTLMNRCLIPSILTPFSSVVRDKLKERRKKHLDTQA